MSNPNAETVSPSNIELDETKNDELAVNKERKRNVRLLKIN